MGFFLVLHKILLFDKADKASQAKRGQETLQMWCYFAGVSDRRRGESKELEP